MTSISADYFENETGLYKHRAAAWGAGVIVFVILIVLTSQFSKSKDAIEKAIITSTEIDTLTSGVNSSEAMAAAAGRKTSDVSKIASSNPSAPQMGRPKTQRMEIKIEQPVVESVAPTTPSVRVVETTESTESPSISTGEVSPPPAQEYAQPTEEPLTNSENSAPAAVKSSGTAATGDGAGALVNGAVDATGTSLESIGVKELTKIRLVYPPQAYHLNRDGYVEIEYSISIDGSTKNIRVISSDPPGMFDKSATASIERMKYAPMIVLGKPVDVVNVRKFIAFNATRD